MTDPKPISVLCELFGTNMYSYQLRSKKTLYTFSVSGTNAYFVLLSLYKFLLVKRKHAKNCILWFEENYPFYYKLRTQFLIHKEHGELNIK